MGVDLVLAIAFSVLIASVVVVDCHERSLHRNDTAKVGRIVSNRDSSSVAVAVPNQSIYRFDPPHQVTRILTIHVNGKRCRELKVSSAARVYVVLP